MTKKYICYRDTNVFAIYYRSIDTVFYNSNFRGIGGIIYLRN